jgi:hypothetical protein
MRALLTALLMALALPLHADQIVNAGGTTVYNPPASTDITTAWMLKRWATTRPAVTKTSAQVAAYGVTGTAWGCGAAVASLASVNALTGSTASNTGCTFFTGDATESTTGASPAGSFYGALSQTVGTRVWWVLADNLANLGARSVVSGSTTSNFVGLGYESSVSANWQCCAGNGASYTCSDTGIAADTSFHAFRVVYPLGGAVQCSVDGAAVTQGSTNPTQSMAAFFTRALVLTSTDNVTSRSMLWASATLETF